MQYRKKFTEQFQKQQHQQIQFKFESIVNISAIKSFESENITLYKIFDFYEKIFTSIIKIEFNWRLITDFEFYSWKTDHVFSKKKAIFQLRISYWMIKKHSWPWFRICQYRIVVLCISSISIEKRFQQKIWLK